MKKTHYHLTITLTDKKIVEYKNVKEYEIMQQGTLYIKIPPTQTFEKGTGNKVVRVKETTECYWIPLHQIKDIKVVAKFETDEAEVCARYDEEGGKSEAPTN